MSDAVEDWVPSGSELDGLHDSIEGKVAEALPAVDSEARRDFCGVAFVDAYVGYLGAVDQQPIANPIEWVADEATRIAVKMANCSCRSATC